MFEELVKINVRPEPFKFYADVAGSPFSPEATKFAVVARKQ